VLRRAELLYLLPSSWLQVTFRSTVTRVTHDCDSWGKIRASKDFLDHHALVGAI
jgi:hypothetical protein